jgi:hypothetical protein
VEHGGENLSVFQAHPCPEALDNTGGGGARQTKPRGMHSRHVPPVDSLHPRRVRVTYKEGSG